MGEKTRRRWLFFYILILLAAVILRLVYVVLDIGYHASWAVPWAMRYRMLYNFIVTPMACAALGAIPALYLETGHLSWLIKPIRLILLPVCVLPVLAVILHAVLWLLGMLEGEWARRLWILVYYVATEPVLGVLFGFVGGLGLRIWLDRKGDV